MSSQKPNKGNPLGRHRVLDAKSTLVQAASQVDPRLPIFSNEILVSVKALQIDSASFHQLRSVTQSGQDLINHIRSLVKKQGKMQNPVTGSGGMLLGEIAEIGANYPNPGVKVGDRIATLVSLTATPLHLEKINGVDVKRERVAVEGHAILFEKSNYVKMPTDLPEGVALAAFDICGAPQLVKKYAKKNDVVLVLGLGKAGVSVVAQLSEAFGRHAKILGLDPNATSVEFCRQNFPGQFEVMNAQNVLEVADWVLEKTQGAGADFVVNTTNVSDTEMASILSTKDQGRCLFFGMSTDFQKVALGAESVLKDIQLLIGTGYTAGHAEGMLALLRKSKPLRQYFEQRF